MRSRILARLLTGDASDCRVRSNLAVPPAPSRSPGLPRAVRLHRDVAVLRGAPWPRRRSCAFQGSGVSGPAGDLERLWLVLDTVPAALVYVDADERYVFSNRYYETNHFRPRAHTLGRTMREVMGEERYARVAPHVRAALEGRTVTFDTRLERPGASPILVRATYTPDLGPDGRVRGFVALSQDITVGAGARGDAPQERAALPPRRGGHAGRLRLPHPGARARTAPRWTSGWST